MLTPEIFKAALGNENFCAVYSGESLISLYHGCAFFFIVWLIDCVCNTNTARGWVIYIALNSTYTLFHCINPKFSSLCSFEPLDHCRRPGENVRSLPLQEVGSETRQDAYYLQASLSWRHNIQNYGYPSPADWGESSNQGASHWLLTHLYLWRRIRDLKNPLTLFCLRISNRTFLTENQEVINSWLFFGVSKNITRKLGLLWSLALKR